MNKMDEQIIVVQRTSIELTAGPLEQGVITDPTYIRQGLEAMFEDFEVMRRGDAEKNTAYKQPIPYLVLTKRIDDEEFVFVYERLKAGGESRLHNKLSVGIGGHMNRFGPKEISTEMMRELEEELQWRLTENPDADPDPFLFGYAVLGFINDDSDEVGQVHLGILVEALSSQDYEVTVRETEELAGEWVSFKDLVNDTERFERLENWSKLAVQAMYHVRP